MLKIVSAAERQYLNGDVDGALAAARAVRQRAVDTSGEAEPETARSKAVLRAAVLEVRALRLRRADEEALAVFNEDRTRLAAFRATTETRVARARLLAATANAFVGSAATETFVRHATEEFAELVAASGTRSSEADALVEAASCCAAIAHNSTRGAAVFERYLVSRGLDASRVNLSTVRKPTIAVADTEPSIAPVASASNTATDAIAPRRNLLRQLRFLLGANVSSVVVIGLVATILLALVGRRMLTARATTAVAPKRRLTL